MMTLWMMSEDCKWQGQKTSSETRSKRNKKAEEFHEKKITTKMHTIMLPLTMKTALFTVQ